MNIVCLLPVLFWTSLATFRLIHGQATIPEEEILKLILSNYNDKARPGTVTTPTVKVDHTLSLLRIVEFGSKTLTAEVWQALHWKDPRLTWTPRSYHGLQSLSIPADSVWLPDVVLYNNGGSEQGQMSKVRATVYYHGMVYLVIPSRIVSYCDSSTPNEQGDVICQWKFGSWTNNGLKVNLTNSRPPDVSNYEVNSAVDVLKVDSTRNEIFYECCPEPYPDITYKLTLKRKQ
ncbi:unnamed protein product [Mytilus coruscus]|uniref:Neurotransmitter-gated ion-channel ligand-binding domain-containing protein n=1 Tax=Mytilus coruscus TaxID=42192 RepID=A0A6J8A7D6_MYTCO|nr:unnamed protein product [Mytilus coruscus]